MGLSIMAAHCSELRLLKAAALAHRKSNISIRLRSKRRACLLPLCSLFFGTWAPNLAWRIHPSLSPRSPPALLPGREHCILAAFQPCANSRPNCSPSHSSSSSRLRSATPQPLPDMHQPRGGLNHGERCIAVQHLRRHRARRRRPRKPHEEPSTATWTSQWTRS